MKHSIKLFSVLALLPFLIDSCNQKPEGNGLPVLTPKESLAHFQLADKNLKVRLVAAEPFVRAPTAIKFDAKGRIWAVEMMGYMPDTAGTGESMNPSGSIVILEDTNKDGRIDNRKVFLDSLILPRAISFCNNGLLVAEPPNLWYVEIQNDKAGKKYLVDSQYAVGGNVEHQPNGLIRGLDNWIYSAKSDVRYRRIKGKWIKEHTHFRGQWGITQDKFGHLYYNNNSMNLIGDYFPPGLGANNPNQHHVSGFREVIVSDNHTYPIHATPGVNRGYREGVLDDSLRLENFTAACGPVIYRSNLLGDNYKGNAFVAGPAANLVKRDFLIHKNIQTTGKQAYQGKEFLASDDERFRPVSIVTGPEGALYIVDMYRGIIQDITYLTPYLKKHIVQNDLAQPLNRGRIYKITPQGENPTIPKLSKKSPKELVHLLNQKNPWICATAQRLLVDNKNFKTVPLLRKQLKDGNTLTGRIRSLWTLEGLGKLQVSDVNALLFSNNMQLQQQAITAIVSIMDKQNANKWLTTAFRLCKNTGSQMAPYIAFLAAEGMKYNNPAAKKILFKLALAYPENPYVVDAVINGLYKHEQDFLHKIQDKHIADSTILYKHLKKVVAHAKEREKELKNQSKDLFAKGKKLFLTYCKVCHGENGEGLQSLGPPLSGSQWVTRDKETLTKIVLHGLTGPIKVGDKLYKTPEIAGEMPSFATNKELTDKKLAQILSFIRNAWENQANAITVEEVKAFREKHKNRTTPFTMKELK